jgi:hypothetical protein
MPLAGPLSIVMAGLDPAIQASRFQARCAACEEERILRRRRLDGRVKPGHDVERVMVLAGRGAVVS